MDYDNEDIMRYDNKAIMEKLKDMECFINENFEKLKNESFEELKNESIKNLKDEIQAANSWLTTIFWSIFFTGFAVGNGMALKYAIWLMVVVFVFLLVHQGYMEKLKKAR